MPEKPAEGNGPGLPHGLSSVLRWHLTESTGGCGLVEVSFASWPGSLSKANEDFVAASPSVAVVLEGPSGLVAVTDRRVDAFARQEDLATRGHPIGSPACGERVQEDGPTHVIPRVRELEDADPRGSRWPRYKRSDDATTAICLPETFQNGPTAGRHNRR
jgi:hypothetical protein